MKADVARYEVKPKTILISTRNSGKLREFGSILSSAYDKILSPADFADFPEIEETGLSFRENALIKAVAASEFLGTDSLADDSGLEVFALDGRPGIYSARYAGPGASDAENNEKLLAELEGKKDRRARFVCCVALALADGTRKFFEGRCHGRILSRARGKGGFGYDPVFYVSEYGKTMAELPPEVKNAISHRAAACAKFLSYLSSR